jgi:hypothetical protein
MAPVVTKKSPENFLVQKIRFLALVPMKETDMTHDNVSLSSELSANRSAKDGNFPETSCQLVLAAAPNPLERSKALDSVANTGIRSICIFAAGAVPPKKPRT